MLPTMVTVPPTSVPRSPQTAGSVDLLNQIRGGRAADLSSPHTSQAVAFEGSWIVSPLLG